MRLKNLATSAASLAMVVAPVAASANPAASLSVAGSVRANAPAGKSRVVGGGIAAAVFVVALLAAALVLPDALDDDSDSN